MQTNLMGWDKGGKQVLLCDDSVPTTEQSKLFSDAKHLHKFPKGIVKMQMRVVAHPHEIPTAVNFLTDDEAKKVQAEHADRLKAVEDAKAKQAAAQTAVEEIKKARFAFNDARAKVHHTERHLQSAKQRMDAEKANARAVPEDRYKKAAAQAEEDYENVLKQLSESKAEFESAKSRIEKLEPKTATEKQTTNTVKI